MTKKANTLSEKRIKQALAACSSHRHRAMFLLSVRAGLRACEVAGLKWAQIDLGDGCLRLRTTKGDKPRNVDLNDELAAELRMLRAELHIEHDHVFTNEHTDKGAPITGYTVSAWFRWLYVDKLGWEGFSSHSGRRTFCTNAARNITEAGGSLKDVQNLMGHEDLATTSEYIDVNEDAKRRVVNMTGRS